MGEDRVDHALYTLKDDHEGVDIAGWIATFFHQHALTRAAA